MAQLSGTKPHLRWNNEKDAWVATGKGGSPIFELPYRFTPTCEVTAGNPDRQMYLRRTHTAEITAGRSLTGIMVSQTFNGNADSGNVDGSEFKARGNTDGTYDLDNMRAVVANVDPKKTDVSTTAKCIESVIENSNGSTIAEARAGTFKIQASGIVTNSYVLYAEGHSGSYADYGLYIRYVRRPIYASCTMTGSSARNAVEIAVTDETTQSTTTYSRGLYVNVAATGAKTGNAEVNGIGVDVTFSGAIAGYGYGMSIYLESSGDPNLNHIAGLSLYLADMGAGTVGAYYGIDLGMVFTNEPSSCAFFRIRSHGGTCDAIFKIEGANPADYLFTSDHYAPFAVASGTYTTAEGYIAIYVDGTARRIPFYDGVDAG